MDLHAMPWIVAFASLLASTPAPAREPIPRAPRAATPLHPLAVTPGGSQRLVVKFVDDARVRLSGPTPVSTAGHDLSAMHSLIAREHLRLTPLVPWSPARLAALASRAAARSGRAQPDLAGMFVITPAASTAAELVRLGNALQADPAVESAWLETIGTPPPADLAPPTPDLEALQTYYAGDHGLDVHAAWNMGLRGQGIRLADVEYGWDALHEELLDTSLHPEPGQTPAPPDEAFAEHGTSVVGVTSAPDNGFGVTGIVPDAFLHTYSEYTVEDGPRRTAAVLASIEASQPGDVVMLELQTPGPDGPDPAPAEYEYSVWLATRMGVDAGVVIVAAAGNGALDLDAEAFAEYRSRGDSGAIIVGAGNAADQGTLDFSNHGARVDVQGWGNHVATIGYGDYARYGDDPHQDYTDSFNGTSSATPMVAAACVALQQLATQVGGAPLSSEQMRTLLVSSGTPGFGAPIGPLPNVRAAARELLAPETTPPLLTITSLADGDHVDAAPWVVDVEIDASDDSLLVDAVQLRIAGQLIDVIDGERPFVFAGVEFPAGAWEIVAQGRDLWGNLGESTPITIYVGVDPPDPTTGGADGTSSDGGGEGTSASTSSSGGDVAASTTAAADSTGGAVVDQRGDDGGCGCASDRGALAGVSLLPLLVLRRRRRRR